MLLFVLFVRIRGFKPVYRKCREWLQMHDIHCIRLLCRKEYRCPNQSRSTTGPPVNPSRNSPRLLPRSNPAEVSEPQTRYIIKHGVARAAKQPMVLETVDLGPLGAEDVEVAVEYCGLCHSDLSVLIR